MKIIFFAPHSAIWIHAFPEALLAESLMRQGHEIVYVGCGGIFNNYCVAMSACGIKFSEQSEKKRRICRSCALNKQILCSNFKFNGFDLTEQQTTNDLQDADTVLLKTTPQNCLDLTIDGVDVGKFALYELLLESKKNNLDFSPEEWIHYQSNLKNTILTLRIMQRVFKKLQPDAVIVYNSLYTVNRVVCRVAEQNLALRYFLHAGGNLSNRIQTLMLAQDSTLAFYGQMLKKWQDVKNRPCSSKILSAVTNHFLEVIKGRSAWAYSVAASGCGSDLKDFFRIAEGQRVICATLSSYDERFAAETVGVLPKVQGLLFPRQTDWVQSLIDYAKKHPELVLIIRVHPREFPNKRENVLSEHARILQEMFADLPDNVHINWPSDEISLYDLANITDVFLNAWSSSGKEMALLGIPVVLYSNDLVLYPPELNYVGTTEHDYYKQVEKALQEGWKPERIRTAYRWGGMEYAYSLLDIADSFAQSEYRQRLPFLKRKYRQILNLVTPGWEQMQDCRKRAARLAVSDKINQVVINRLNSVLDTNLDNSFSTEEEEAAALKIEVGRLYQGLFGDIKDWYPESALAGKLYSYVHTE